MTRCTVESMTTLHDSVWLWDTVYGHRCTCSVQLCVQCCDSYTSLKINITNGYILDRRSKVCTCVRSILNISFCKVYYVNETSSNYNIHIYQIGLCYTDKSQKYKHDTTHNITLSFYTYTTHSRTIPNYNCSDFDSVNRILSLCVI